LAAVVVGVGISGHCIGVGVVVCFTIQMLEHPLLFLRLETRMLAVSIDLLMSH
jgi:hypothetical protein